MADGAGAGALGRRPPNPGPDAAPRPATAPSSAAPRGRPRPDAPPSGVQDTVCQACGGRSESGNATRCHCKQAADHAKNESRQAKEAVLKMNRISRPDSSDKSWMHKPSGGTYTKPEAKVKLIPSEEITYVRYKKRFSRTVIPDGSQKKNCKRSATPPPSSRKVSLVKPVLLTQNPTPSASTVAPCHFPKRLETTENRHSVVRGCITRSLTAQTASLKNCPPASCKDVLPQPSGTSLITALKTLSSKNSREAFASVCSSSNLQSPDHSSAVPPASLIKEALIRPISPGSKISSISPGSKISSIPPGSVRVLAAQSNLSEVHGTEAKSSSKSKSACTPDKGNLGLTSCDGDNSRQHVRSLAAHIVQNVRCVKPKLLSPTSVLTENYTKAYQDGRPRRSASLNLLNGKCNLTSMQCGRNTPPIQRPQSTPTAQSVKLSNDYEAGHSSKSPSSNEKRSNQKVSTDCNTSSGTPVILHTRPHKKHDQPESCWKGKFEVIGELTCTCNGLEAHLALEVLIKVYESSKQMPETLKLEALPLSRLWPKTFKIKPPDGQDIGLCFTSSLQRPNRSLDYLLENTSHIGLRIDIGTIELLIFSSELLTQDYQKKGGKFYLWGVFRNQHSRKQHQYNNSMNCACTSITCLSNGGSCDRSEEIGMGLDFTQGKESKIEKCENDVKLDTRGSKEMDRDKSKENAIKLDTAGDRGTDRVSICLATLKTPDSNAAATSAPVTGHHSPNSTHSPCQSATRAADSDMVLELEDTPPGFSLDIPPGFTKDDCRFRSGETAESNISHSLVLDTPPGFSLDIPPGFTEADCRLPTVASDGSEAGVSSSGSERKPLIKFSLNVRRPLQTVALPGFTRLNPVKKEPGSPAGCEATRKTAPTGKVDEMKIKHEVKMETEERSSEEREFPKTKLIADILFPSPATQEETPSPSPLKVTPRNCTQVRRPELLALPVPAEHRRKRGQQEAPPPEPSAADAGTAKRARVVAPNIFR